MQRFEPLFKKYLNLIKSGKINFQDKEMKRFVLCFNGNIAVKKALKKDYQNTSAKKEAIKNFNFVKETYGQADSDEIRADLYTAFFTLVKRYKKMGRNFCGYLYNAYCYEVYRLIKKYIKDPTNIIYRKAEYEDIMQTYNETIIDECFEDRIYEDNMGLPDVSWISGESCSELFGMLEPFDRKLLIKYYLEDYNDRQMAEELGMHANTVNQQRRKAVLKLADALGISKEDIKHNRKSGKKALFAMLHQPKPKFSDAMIS